MGSRESSLRERSFLGARFHGGGRCGFRVWAPAADRVDLHIIEPFDRVIPMISPGNGYHEAAVEGVGPGARYLYRLNGALERPDPASRYQPDGVQGPSQVVDPEFLWTDARWSSLPLKNYVIYELHVGAFTAEGTFDASIRRLDDLRALGVTAIELMPVAQFPGNRNWGYDGVYPYAVQNSYGGPRSLKKVVDHCHQRGLAAVLDVVYNHLGPEGNYLADFGPYFTDRYTGPWGAALNFNGADSDEVRRFFIENAKYWFDEFHFDALRLDAVHAILDFSPFSFLEELGAAITDLAAKLGRPLYLIPESAANDPRLIRGRDSGGLGHHAQWSDDFHHSLHALLTGERDGYYQDYGTIEDLAEAFREGFVYSGRYSSYRRRRHGSSSRDIPAERFVVCAQNHDQVGNRRDASRLGGLVSFEKLKLAAGAVILSPFIPLLFMGEEYGETAPFLYFISHSDPDLVEAVRRGRKREFAAFGLDDPPDPQSEETFLRSKLDWRLRDEGRHRILLDFYAELLRLRKEIPALSRLSKNHLTVTGDETGRTLSLRRWDRDSQVYAGYNFGSERATSPLPLPAGVWETLLSSADARWGGPGCRRLDEIKSDGKTVLETQGMSFTLLRRRPQK
jgi:maltooligosyltrehalose trehalohydrolase